MKRFREAYSSHRCPICAYPIARGALKNALWTRKGPKPVVAPMTATAEEEDGPYACPSCGTHLYEKCENCNSRRHSLLPYCDRCGHEKTVTELKGTASAV
jgi:predicted RNA-binding Zn-ribbon protein involved in translation (DUF1610 family)